MLAKPWREDKVDPTDWLMGEKLDGLRADWDGWDFYSREGNKFHAPAWFKKGLPRTPLDGELNAGRGGFQEASSTVRSQGMSDAWRRIKFSVFDAPSKPGGFEERAAEVPRLIKDAPYAEVIKHRKAKSAADVKRELKRVERLGGEGLVLRKRGSPYEGRRTSTFLKVKTFHDAEARVTGYYPGKGKHTGVIGGFYVETLQDQRVRGGIRFKLGGGLSDAERRRPPKIGSLVTYKYQGTSDGGTPRFASFLRVRKNPAKHGYRLRSPGRAGDRVVHSFLVEGRAPSGLGLGQRYDWYWSGDCRTATIFHTRQAALARAEEAEAETRAAGYDGLRFEIVPARGGTPISRRQKNPRRSSRKRQRQLERDLFGPGPREREPRRGARATTELSDAHRYGPPGIPGDCWACGNVCDPVDEWQCPVCEVVYPPVRRNARGPRAYRGR